MTVDIKRTPISFAGVALTNAARRARFLISDSGAQNAPLYDVVSASRIGEYPAFVRLQPPEGKAFPVLFDLRTVTEEQVRLLRDLFDPSTGRQALVIEDGDAVQRTVTVAPLGLQEHDPPFSWVAPLWATEPILLKAGTASSESQTNIDNGGHVFQPENDGDVETWPELAITPTAKKNIRDSWTFLRRCVLVNNSEVPLADPVSKVGLGRGYPVDLANAGWDTSILIRATPQLSTIADGGDGITDSQLTIGVNDPGSFNPDGGMAWLGAAGSGEQVKYDSVSGSNLVIPAGGRGWGGTTAQAHSESTPVFDSKLVADGRDIAVFVNDVRVPPERISLSGINTANTKVFCPLEVPERRRFVLDAAIGSGDTKFTIREGIERLPPAPGYIRIDSETIRYGLRDLVTGQLTVTRGAENTTPASHSAGATIHWVPLRIEVGYGWAEAPARPTNPDPIVFNLATSTNAAWEIILQPWSSVKGPGGFVRKRTGKNRFADRVSLASLGTNGAAFADQTPTANVPAYDTLEFYAPCGIAASAGAIEFDSIQQGGAMVLELELIDLGGNRTIVGRYHGHTAGVAQHDPHTYTNELFQPALPVRALRFRGRQAVVTGAITDDIDETMQGEAVTGVDLQTFTLEQATVMFGFMARLKESGVSCNMNADLKVFSGDPSDLAALREILLPGGWSVPNADITTSYKNFCYFPVYATKTVLPSGLYGMKLFETGGAVEGLVLARNAQPIYQKGSHWRFNSVGPVWEEQAAQDIWFLVLGEFDDNDDNETDNQPEAPSNTGHLVTIDNVKITFDTNRTPTVDLRPEEDAYYIESTISRAGQSCAIAHLQRYTGSRAVEIDFKTGVVSDGEYGDEHPRAITPTNKAKRFTLPPGQTDVTYTPAGGAQPRETAALEWRSAWQA